MGLGAGFGMPGMQGGFGGGHFLQQQQLGVNGVNRANGTSSAFIPGSVLLVSNLNEEVWLL